MTDEEIGKWAHKATLAIYDAECRMVEALDEELPTIKNREQAAEATMRDFGAALLREHAESLKHGILTCSVYEWLRAEADRLEKGGK